MDVLMKVLYNGPRMRNCTFLGATNSFSSFSSTIVVVFRGGCLLGRGRWPKTYAIHGAFLHRASIHTRSRCIIFWSVSLLHFILMF